MTRQTQLEDIIPHVKKEIAHAESIRPLETSIKPMLRDAPPVRSLAQALRGEFGLIAEIKAKSPSKGLMSPSNVHAAPDAYERSSIVKALSILTNNSHFGMSIETLRDIRNNKSTKPILRKDFIISPYQVFEARAFGADAILLMSQALSVPELHKLHALAVSLDLEVLVECRTRQDLDNVPANARIVGINSREFEGRKRFAISRMAANVGIRKDFSTDLEVFRQIKHMPRGVIKVAESGMTARNIVAVRELGFNAALIGNALLNDSGTVGQNLYKFEIALSKAPKQSRGAVRHRQPDHALG